MGQEKNLNRKYCNVVPSQRVVLRCVISAENLWSIALLLQLLLIHPSFGSSCYAG